MNADVDTIRAALANLSDDDLHALITSANESPQLVPGFLAWLEHIADWEQNRRAGRDYALQPPEAVIEPEEMGDSVTAAMMLGGLFERDGQVAVAALFSVLTGMLNGNAMLH